MKRLFFIGCWTLILTLLIPDRAKGDTFVDSLRREIKVLPDSSKLIRLNELLYANTHNKVYKKRHRGNVTIITKEMPYYS